METCVYLQAESDSRRPLWSHMLNELEDMCEYDDNEDLCKIDKCKGQLDCSQPDNCKLNCKKRRNRDAFPEIRLHGFHNIFLEQVQCSSEVATSFSCRQQSQCGTLRLLDFDKVDCNTNHQLFQDNRVKIDCYCKLCTCSDCSDKACSCKVNIEKASIIETPKTTLATVQNATQPIIRITATDTETTSGNSTGTWMIGSSRMSDYNNPSPMTGAIVGSVVPIVLILAVVVFIIIWRRYARFKVKPTRQVNQRNFRFANSSYDLPQNNDVAESANQEPFIYEEGVDNSFNSKSGVTGEQQCEFVYDVVRIEENKNQCKQSVNEVNVGEQKTEEEKYLQMSSSSEKTRRSGNGISNVHGKIIPDTDFKCFTSSDNNPYQNFIVEKSKVENPQSALENETSKAGYEIMRCSYDKRSPSLLKAVEGDCQLEYDMTYCFSPVTPVSIECALESHFSENISDSVTILEPLQIEIRDSVAYNILNENKKQKVGKDMYDHVRNIVEANPYSNVDNPYDNLTSNSKPKILLHPGYEQCNVTSLDNNKDVQPADMPRENPYENVFAKKDGSRDQSSSCMTK